MRLSLILILFIIASCSSNKNVVNEDSFVNKSFLLINQQNDSIQIELIPDCLRTYSWDFKLIEEWKVYEQDNSVYLNLEGESYIITNQGKDSYILSNDNYSFELMEINEPIIDEDLLIGDWIEDKYMHFLTDTYPSPPPCPNYSIDTFFVPQLTFSKDSCVIRGFCSKSDLFYTTNEYFGMIRLDNHCTDLNIWRIIKLSNDTLIVDKKYLDGHEMKYEKAVKYLKYGG